MTVMTLSFVSLYQREENSHLYSTVKSVCESVCENPSKICQNGGNCPKSAKVEGIVFTQLIEFKEVVKLKGSGFGSRKSGVRIPLPRPVFSIS